MKARLSAATRFDGEELLPTKPVIAIPMGYASKRLALPVTSKSR
jgi:hypothetical protein